MNDDIRSVLESFGYGTANARVIAAKAVAMDLTLADVTAWIHEAKYSRTIRNPRGFVRAVIARGDKPPAARPSRSTHPPDFHERLNLLCPDCQTRPCVCDWDPAIESFIHFRERTVNPTGGTTC